MGSLARSSDPLASHRRERLAAPQPEPGQRPRQLVLAEEADGRDLERSMLQVLPKLEGAYSLVVMDASHVVGVRDPNGFRPLCLGRLSGGWVLASESPALDVVGAHFVRELEPGEMVVIDANGVRSLNPFPPERVNPKLCIFEFAYFARPDSMIHNQRLHLVRQRMGEELAREQPAADPSDNECRDDGIDRCPRGHDASPRRLRVRLPTLLARLVTQPVA